MPMQLPWRKDQDLPKKGILPPQPIPQIPGTLPPEPTRQDMSEEDKQQLRELLTLMAGRNQEAGHQVEQNAGLSGWNQVGQGLAAGALGGMADFLTYEPEALGIRTPRPSTPYNPRSQRSMRGYGAFSEAVNKAWTPYLWNMAGQTIPGLVSGGILGAGSAIGGAVPLLLAGMGAPLAANWLRTKFRDRAEASAQKIGDEAEHKAQAGLDDKILAATTALARQPAQIARPWQLQEAGRNVWIR